MVASRGKTGQGENGGRPGNDLDEKIMASGCDVLFGVIGDKLQFVRFFSRLAAVASRGKSVQGRGKAWKRCR